MHQSRLLVALGGFLVVVSIGAFFFVEAFMKFVNVDLNFLMFTAVPFLVGTASLMYGYLRGGMALSSGQANERLAAELQLLGRKLEDLQAGAASAGTPASALTPQQQGELFQTLKSQAEAAVTTDVVKGIETRFAEQVQSTSLMRELDELCERTERLLRGEIEALSRRGNLNLVIGVLTTLVAVGILASTVMFDKIPPDLLQLTTHFVPRVTLSLFIEVFSFFFLRLYSNSLAEIKYFQNELTNVESRFIALRRAAYASDKTTLSKLLLALASTERNFILKKGETTADLERAKTDAAQHKELISLLTELTKNRKASRE